MDTLKRGNMSFTWLNGGVTHLDGGAMFGVVPKALWSKKYPVDEYNRIELRTDPIFFQKDGKNFIIDSGIGNGRLSEKQLRNYGVLEESHVDKSLSKLGLTPEDIDYCLMTHMHFDHVLGLTKKAEDGELLPAFPNATIITSEVEWNEIRNPNIRSRNTYWKENWIAIEQQVKTFKDFIEVLDGVMMIHTGGHSDGHSVVKISDGKEVYVHLADIMATHAHQNPLWVMAYDDYPMTSIFAKDKWLKEILENEYWCLFYHDGLYRAVKWSKENEIIDSLKRER
ncbi:hypothetical protein Q73_11260 [Bacillus coahuilensis m2-6]|uniref:YtnP family quorum-quenching lactonase n=1 Tax=Bacillus coahuilensis TaxID=408580 RepID=UPI000750540A|nr:MBL fold metallo-hydrolase [Bacillus coahuilensis]KUP06718.1 hypothetical protein Q73_11260 [Bacillus coahuilensis m2-6]